MSELPWGRRYLMCRPRYFGVRYEINPWMHVDTPPDPDRAAGQFDSLVHSIRSAGAVVEFLDPVEGLPDLVFTANAGIVNGSTFIPSRFRFSQRRAETPYDVAWFAERGYRIVELTGSGCNEGAGDALPFIPQDGRPCWICGYRIRSDISTHAALTALTRIPTKSLELADPRYYHLDLNFCPLDDRRAMIAPTGIDRFGLSLVESVIPELLLLEPDEVGMFCANSVVIGRNIVMPACTPRLGKVLESWGFSLDIVDVSEFLKAGGACRCLTLALDVDLASPSSEASVEHGLHSD